MLSISNISSELIDPLINDFSNVGLGVVNVGTLGRVINNTVEEPSTSGWFAVIMAVKNVFPTTFSSVMGTLNDTLMGWSVGSIKKKSLSSPLKVNVIFCE